MNSNTLLKLTCGIAIVLTSLIGTGQATAQATSEKTQPTKTQPTKTQPTKTQPTKTQPTRIRPTRIKPTKKVVYKTIDKTKLMLHVFEPTDHQTTDQAPAIVFFFGGGWNVGTPMQFYEQSQYLAKQGVVCFSADYRVKSRQKVTPVECIADAKSAIRWVRQHAKELGVNPDQIVAAGGSAGGHVAACTGVLKGHDEANEDASISSAPNAMILFNPALDTSPETGYALGRFPKGKEILYSPNHKIHKGIAPTLMFHGTGDKIVPFKQATQFTELMKAAGNRCELHSFEGKGHGFFNGKHFRPRTKDLKPYEKTMNESIKFLTSLNFIKPAANSDKAVDLKSVK